VRSQLPSALRYADVFIDSRVIPSSSLGGDFVGYTAAKNSIVFYLLDVSGHGVASGLLAVSLHHAIRQLHVQHHINMPPSQVLEELNNLFQLSTQDGRFTTLWYGHLELNSRKLHYANAGHHPALFIRDGQAIELDDGGPPVGVMPDLEYLTKSVLLQHSDRIYLFSDGLFEPFSSTSEFSPRDRLHSLILNEDSSTNSNLDQVIANARAAAHVKVFKDDVSLLKVKINHAETG